MRLIVALVTVIAAACQALPVDEQTDVVALDRGDPQSTATLKAMARHAVDEASASPQLARFLSHRAVAMSRT